MNSASGMLVPASYKQMVERLTPSLSANCFCVRLKASRVSRTRAEIRLRKFSDILFFSFLIVRFFNFSILMLDF